MSAMLKGRKSKAASLVPLALLSAAWTASLVGVDTASATRADATPTLPDGSSVPDQAIEAPASVPIPGQIAPAVPDGTQDQVVSGASATGIPAAALAAYQRGAQIINAADPTCNLPWELLAAVGRVESNHGQYGGNVLGEDGIARPGIYGPELNGKHGTQAIMDTDGGQLDHDTVYDRAVGPMQFIPSTWSSVKVDADGDGQRNPQDIDDASLAAAVYLCSGNENLSTRAGQEAAVLRYNHSQSYVDLVLRIMEAYSQGEYTAIPSGTYGGTVFTPTYAAKVDARKPRTAPKATKPARTAPKNTGSSTSTGSTGSTGSDTGSTGSSSPLAPVTEPLTKTLDSVTKTLDGATGGTVGTVTEPVTAVLSTLTEATAFCGDQLSTINDPFNLLGSLANSLCGQHVVGMSETDAAAVIPNTLTAVLAWLGL